MRIVDWLIEKKENTSIVLEEAEEHITYKELYWYSMKIANEIITYTSDEECNIGLYAKGSINYIIGFFSILFAGKCVVPINYDLTLKSINELVQYADISCLVGDHTIDIQKNQILIRREFGSNEILKYHADDNILLLQTTGTTSTSEKRKLVKINDSNLVFVVEAVVREMDLRKDELNKLWMLLPTQSAYGNCIFLACICAGVTIFFSSEWMPWDFHKVIVENNITHIECISTHLAALMKINKYNEWENLRYIGFGGASISGCEVRKISQYFSGIILSQKYGLTEAGPLISIFPMNLACDNKFIEKSSSVGKVISGIDVKFRNDGEILVKGPNVTCGYYKNDNSSLFDKGFLITGDLGYIDTDGFLYIKGRKKNVIIVGGNNVQIEEVENTILSYNGIEEVRVYSIPDSYLGEALAADIVAKVQDEIGLHNYLVSELELYKIPQEINWVSEIAKIGGKIKRL